MDALARHHRLVPQLQFMVFSRNDATRWNMCVLVTWSTQCGWIDTTAPLFFSQASIFRGRGSTLFNVWQVAPTKRDAFSLEYNSMRQTTKVNSCSRVVVAHCRLVYAKREIVLKNGTCTGIGAQTRYEMRE